MPYPPEPHYVNNHYKHQDDKDRAIKNLKTRIRSLEKRLETLSGRLTRLEKRAHCDES